MLRACRLRTTVYLRDLGIIENGTDILSAYAHVNGRRTVYIPVTKRADASTLDVINEVRAEIPNFKKAVPEDVDISLEFDQSRYVTNSIKGLVTEGLLGAVLTGLMVLLFLRDWRSALIVVTTIPFALLSAVVFLWAAGQTINIMTLGGLALAVGVLVDEATVEIENIHTQMTSGTSRASPSSTRPGKRRFPGCSPCSAFWLCSYPRFSWWESAANSSFRCPWPWGLR